TRKAKKSRAKNERWRRSPQFFPLHLSLGIFASREDSWSRTECERKHTELHGKKVFRDSKNAPAAKERSGRRRWPAGCWLERERIRSDHRAEHRVEPVEVEVVPHGAVGPEELAVLAGRREPRERPRHHDEGRGAGDPGGRILARDAGESDQVRRVRRVDADLGDAVTTVCAEHRQLLAPDIAVRPVDLAVRRDRPGQTVPADQRRGADPEAV